MADLIILPVVRSLRHSLDALEQRDREIMVMVNAELAPPPQTRALLAINNTGRGGITRPVAHGAADCGFAAASGVMRDVSGEGEL